MRIPLRLSFCQNGCLMFVVLRALGDIVNMRLHISLLGLLVFSLLISLLMIVRICVLYPIIIIKSEM